MPQYTKDVKDRIADLENRGYERNDNPKTQVVQMRKSCQVTFLEFQNTDKEGSPIFTSRGGSDVLQTPVLVQILNSSLKVKATLYKTSFEKEAVIPNSVYSCMITNVITEKGKNTLNPNHKNSYFTMFSNAGSVVSSDELASLGL